MASLFCLLLLTVSGALASLSPQDAVEAPAPFLSFPLRREELFVPFDGPHGTGRVPARALLSAGGGARRAQGEVPIYGDFRRLAYYYADLFIGSRQQRFTVIADTGSSLTAVPCVDCVDCGQHMDPWYTPALSTSAVSLTCAAGCPSGHACVAGGKCGYTQSYAEGSSLSGVLYRDSVYLGSSGDGNPEAAATALSVDFVFGCGGHEGGLFRTQEADGIMGLSTNTLSITTVLFASGKLTSRIFSLCLSFQGGAMTFGSMDSRLHTTPPSWASLSVTGFYVVHVDAFSIGGDGGTPIEVNGFNSPHTIIDSGTTFTYVPGPAYRALRSHISTWCGAVGGRCKGAPANVANEPLCYRLSTASDIDSFPPATFVFRGSNGGAAATVTIPPSHLFVNMGWDAGAYCLAVYDNGNGGGVIGGNAMMGYDVIFDIAGTGGSGPRVGFAPSTCVLPPPLPSPSPTSVPPPPPPPPPPTDGESPPSPSSPPPAVINAPSPTSNPASGDTSVPGATPSHVSTAQENNRDGPSVVDPSTSGKWAIGGIAVSTLCAASLCIYCCVNACECRLGRFVISVEPKAGGSGGARSGGGGGGGGSSSSSASSGSLAPSQYVVVSPSGGSGGGGGRAAPGTIGGSLIVVDEDESAAGGGARGEEEEEDAPLMGGGGGGSGVGAAASRDAVAVRIAERAMASLRERG